MATTRKLHKLNITKAPEDFELFGRNIYQELRRAAADPRDQPLSTERLFSIVRQSLEMSKNVLKLPDTALSEGPGDPVVYGDNQDETDDFDPAKFWSAQGMN